MADDAPYYADGAGRSLAKKFELQAYDLRAYLKKFSDETGEEAISDGFGQAVPLLRTLRDSPLRRFGFLNVSPACFGESLRQFALTNRRGRWQS